MSKNPTFRDELVKIMPGYSWTVHRHAKDAARVTATGIQSSGFNRLSTLQVVRSEIGGNPWYTAKFAGHGTHAKWVHESSDVTLVRAIRGLQQHCEQMANTYHSHAAKLRAGRRPKGGAA